MTAVTGTEPTAQPESRTRNRARLAAYGIVAAVTAGSLTFAGIQTGASDQAHAQVSQLSGQIAEIRSQLSTVESRQSAAQTAAINARLAHLGVCWYAGTVYGAANGGVTYVQSVSVDSPQV